MNFVNREWFPIFLKNAENETIFNKIKNVKTFHLQNSLLISRYPNPQHCCAVLQIDDNKSDIVCFILKNVAVFFRQNIYIFRKKSNIDDIYN